MKPMRAALMAVATLSAGVCATAALGDDRAAIDRTQIIGNRELPKVLYIVPWKKPAPGDLAGAPAESVLDEALAPLDRDVFRRQVHYDTLMQPSGVARSAGEAPVPQPAPNQK
jgi:hypothetical protein